MLENDFRGSPLVLDFQKSFGQRKSRNVRIEMRCVGWGSGGNRNRKVRVNPDNVGDPSDVAA